MSNPFASLRLGGGSSEPKLVAKTEDFEAGSPNEPLDDVAKLSATLETIFQITLNSSFESSSKCKYAIFLGDSNSNSDEKGHLSLSNLDDLLLQRILANDRNELLEKLRPVAALDDPAAQQASCLELRSFYYLFRCFKRLIVSDLPADQMNTCSNLIVNLCRTLLTIFDSDDVNVSVIQKALSEKFRSSQPNQSDHDYSSTFAESFIRENFQLKDLSIQFLYLALDSLGLGGKTGDSKTFEVFFDRFVELFEESQETQSYYEAVEKNESTTRLDQAFLEPFELRFLSKLFVYLERFVISTSDCDFFSVKYTAYLELVKALTKSKLMKYLFVLSSFPSNGELQNGRAWQEKTLIGKLLTPHSLPLAQPKKQLTSPPPANQLLSRLLNQQQREYQVEYSFFTSPSTLTKRDVEIYEQNVWDRLKTIQLEQSKLFYEHLIKSGSNKLVRSLFLKWLGMCMFANKARGQEWSNYMHPAMAMMSNSNLARFGSDGFFLNILGLLLQCSMPFARKANSQLLLKIDPRYGIAKVNRDPYDLTSLAGPRFIGFDKETKMLAPNEETSDATPGVPDETVDFNFITECFFATHQCFQLAFISVYQKLMKINNDISRWQQTYQALAESHGQGDEQVQSLKRNYENMSTEFLNIKTVLLQDELLSKLIGFVCSSSSWLTHLAIDAEDTAQIKPLTHLSQLAGGRTSQASVELLRMTPEFFVTNVVELFIFLSRFKEANLDSLVLPDDDDTNLNAFFSLVLVFMGSPDRLFNPHIRGQLAEAVEAIVPRKARDSNASRKRLALAAFVKHPCSAYFSEALLNVFVSIEMTGQSVQFEQKFNYRRPMYELLEFLWYLPESFANDQSVRHEGQLLKHRIKLKELADQAFACIEHSEQPLFLKFLNFLINDANYLLLEGLLYLEKIKSSQDKLERDSMIRSQSQPEEAPMSNEQRGEVEKNLKHMIMLAKFHNFMSLKTIQTVKQLTSDIKDIFCHEVLVDRVAVMLNDFLLHLVGPKKRKQLKVKNFDEVEFKPHEVVSKICDIYLNLGVKEQFCQAVCRDGRSYSPELFPIAQDVLSKIGRDYEMIESFKQLGKKIETILAQQRSEENAFDDAPDEYLDPIMSHVMSDPVILPSSKKVIDRSTIARHLLSDQTDPFNRSPLTLPEVIPATELKREIEAWKSSKRLSSNN